MDKSVFLFHLFYCAYNIGTNNLLHILLTRIFVQKLLSLALAKSSCNNINNSRA